MLQGTDRKPFRFAEAVFWSLTWAFGVALGVALGGWLTLVGGAGAPGVSDLDPVSDLLVLPGAAFGVVFVLQLLVRSALAALRGRTKRGSENQREE